MNSCEADLHLAAARLAPAAVCPFCGDELNGRYHRNDTWRMEPKHCELYELRKLRDFVAELRDKDGAVTVGRGLHNVIDLARRLRLADVPGR